MTSDKEKTLFEINRESNKDVSLSLLERNFKYSDHKIAVSSVVLFVN